MHTLFYSGRQTRRHLKDIAVDERMILKTKFVIVQAMRAYRKSGSLAPLLLNLGIKWR
jgi:hypothetical protein